jgi:hypothetical protein
VPAEGLGQAGRQLFYDEANAMAVTHPFIVTCSMPGESTDIRIW